MSSTVRSPAHGPAEAFRRIHGLGAHRVADAILFSCLFWALAADGRTLDAALALFTLVVSLSVSHIRAEAEAVGVQLTEGSSSGSNGSSR